MYQFTHPSAVYEFPFLKIINRLLSFCQPCKWEILFHRVFLFAFPDISKIEDLFIDLLAIWISSFVTRPFSLLEIIFKTSV